MPNSLDSSNDVNVNSWEQFLQDNDNALVLLNQCSIHISDVMANINSIELIEQQLNALTDELQIYKINLPEIGNLLTCGTRLSDWCSKHDVDVIIALRAIEKAIDEYNKGMATDKESAFGDIFKFASDIGIYWMLYNGLSKTKFGALAFLMGCATYANDALNDGGDFLVGDMPTLLFGDAFASVILGDAAASASKMQLVWINATTGAGLVFVYELIKGIYNDEGNWTPKDTQRLILDSTGGAIEYASWTIVAGEAGMVITGLIEGAGVGTAIAGPIGGVAGAALATGVVFLIRPAYQLLSDEITGDKIIHTFVDSQGKVRKIPRNGNGRSGTYDVILERYMNNLTNSGVSATQKFSLYKEIENGYSLQSSYSAFNTEYDDYSSYQSDVRVLNAYLEKIRQAKSMDDVANINIESGFIKFNDKLIAINSIDDHGVPCDNVFTNLIDIGFDPEEYYAYTHNDYAYIADNNISKSTQELIDQANQGNVPNSNSNLESNGGH